MCSCQANRWAGGQADGAVLPPSSEGALLECHHYQIFQTSGTFCFTEIFIGTLIGTFIGTYTVSEAEIVFASSPFKVQHGIMKTGNL